MPSSSYGYVINMTPLLSQFWICHWYNHVLSLRDKRNPATTKYIWLLILKAVAKMATSNFNLEEPLILSACVCYF